MTGDFDFGFFCDTSHIQTQRGDMVYGSPDDPVINVCREVPSEDFCLEILEDYAQEVPLGTMIYWFWHHIDFVGVVASGSSRVWSPSMN